MPRAEFRIRKHEVPRHVPHLRLIGSEQALEAHPSQCRSGMRQIGICASAFANPRLRCSRFALATLVIAQLLVFTGLAAAAPVFGAPANSDSLGSLTGKLTDRYSVPLVEAVVVLRNASTGAVARCVTAKNGAYHFAGLDPGEYRLEAQVPQLGKGSVEGILIAAGHASRVQAALIMELPSLEPDLPLLSRQMDPVTSAVTSFFAAEELNSLELPLQNWHDLSLTTPGSNPPPQIAAATGAASGGQIGDPTGNSDEQDSPDDAPSVNASSGASESLSINGTPTSHGFQGNSTALAATETLGNSAIDTIEMQGSVSPVDDPTAAGGAISLTTRRGGSSLHGQLNYLNRQPFWNAQSPMTNWVQEIAPVSPIDVAQFGQQNYSLPNGRQSFGMGAGGPLLHNRVNWFAALDLTRRNDPAMAAVRHPDQFFARPSDNQLAVLSARLAIPGPALLENSISQYSQSLEQLDALLGPVPRTATQIQGFGRLDWAISERQNLSLDLSAASADAPAGGVTRALEYYGSHSFGNSFASQYSGSAKLDSFFTPNLLNSLAVHYRHRTQRDTPQAPSDFEAPLMSNTWGELPEIITDSRNGFVLGKPARLGKSNYPDEHSVGAQETLSWVLGKHLLRFSAGFDHLYDSVDTLVNQTGTYSYADAFNFISDRLSFLKYGFDSVGSGVDGEHNCDQTGRVYVKGGAEDHLGGRGSLPCYAWYSQRVGPSNWHLSTNYLTASASEQWQAGHTLTLSAGLRVEDQQLPPALPNLVNPDLPDTQTLPAKMLSYAPRVGLAWAPFKKTVVRAGAGLYYGRIDNSAILSALTQTGSPNGDLNFFFKPTDAGAPPFPFVFSGDPQTAVVPGAVAFSSRFKNREVTQAVVSLEQDLPDHWMVSLSGLMSLGRRLPISIDTNLQQATDAQGNPSTITYDVIDPLGEGPVKTPTLTVPLYKERLLTTYQQVDSIESRANSTYEALQLRIQRTGHSGLNFRGHYLYAHAIDFNPNESATVQVNDVLDPSNFGEEKGTSNMDIRHSAVASLTFRPTWKMHGPMGNFANGWAISGTGQFHSGLPFTMRTAGYIPGFYNSAHQLIEGVGPGINGSAGDNRLYSVGRNTYRNPPTWSSDARLAKQFHLAGDRSFEVFAQSFNFFNHRNVTRVETTGYHIYRGTPSGGPPTLNFLSGLKAGTVGFGQPLDTNATPWFRQRMIELGVKASF